MAKERNTKLKRVTSLFMSAVMAATLVQVQLAPGAAAEESFDSTTEEVDSLSIVSNKNAYRKYINRYPDAIKPMEEINVDVTDFEQSDDVDVKIEDYDGESDCVAWVDCEGTLTWHFDVKTAGLYNLEMFYHPVTSEHHNNTTIEVEMKIDGEHPFDEVKLVELDRYWQNDGAIIRDSRDNDQRPKQIQYNTWVNYPIKDKDGLINTPYFFYLSEGSHEISLTGVKTNLYLKGMRFYNTEDLPAYADIAPTQEQIDATPSVGESGGFIQGEAPAYTTSSTLYPTYDRTDSSVYPCDPVKKRYNTIGADTWDQATQSITWNVEVPEDGYYKVRLRARQSTMRGFFSNRRVYINGEVPCTELDDVKIQYDPNWQTVDLSDADGNLIYVKMNKGWNTITLEAVPGDIGAVMERLDDLIFELNYYYRRILMITGPSPDEYNDYYLEDQIEGLFDFFKNAIETLYREKAGIEELTGAGSEASTLQTMAVILQMAVDKPEDLPQMLSSIKDQISAVSAWMRDYRDQPLEIDYIEVKSSKDEFRKCGTNFFQAFAFGFQAFIGSFFEDYTSVSDSSGAEKTLNVWVSLGRDQATVVNELVSSEYNPTHDTKVNISLVQGAVLEATLAGKGPEVALFIGGDFPVVCASRGLLVNLKEQPGYESVISRFTPDVTTLYEFNGGVYGLPLTESFPMLFYRTDVLGELGYDAPPETWDDLINMLPDIQRKYLEVGLILPSNISSQVFDAGNTFVLLMLQTGQDFYNYDEASGQYISTTFDTEAAVSAFTKWTQFYTIYDFDQTYDAFTRFRTGEMPILLQNYTFYNQLNVAAPEIKGLWSFAHVPGSYVYNEDGTKQKNSDGSYKIDYTANSGSAGAVIFTSCTDVDAAWNFIDWFTTTDVQKSYGTTIEAVMGPMGRYDTANVEALGELSWSTSEHEKIADQMSNLREVPIIPASYAVTRNVYNAFRAVVNNQKNPRYQLSSYNRDINSEIVRKLTDLGYYKG